MTAVAVAMSTSLSIAQNRTTVTQPPRTPQEQIAAGDRAAPAGLSDLDAMTFGCPKVGLNAAAREAAKDHQRLASLVLRDSFQEQLRRRA